MSQEIDKLKIENKMLSDRNDHLEDKLSKISDSRHRSATETSRLLMVERELQNQQEWNRRMETELVTKSA
jgi:predicted RNase H-like nuclease (RuvC/YqgF family)